MKTKIFKKRSPFAVKFLFLSFLLLFSFILYATSVVNQGTEAKKTDINCQGSQGNISIRTGVHYTEGAGERIANYRNGVSLGYNGTQSANCRWLQFIYRQILVTRRTDGGGETTRPKSGRVRTTGGSYQLTTNPTQPNYNVDSGSSTNPYYEARFSSIRTGNSTTIYDRPGSGINSFAAAEKRDPKVTKIESIITFDTFLVCNNKICAKVSWTITYTWTPGAGGGTETGPTPNISDPVKPGSLNQRQTDRFKALYPNSTVPS